MASVVVPPSTSQEAASTRPAETLGWSADKFRIGSRPLPKTVRRKQVLWMYVVALGGVHLLAALALLPWFFSWTGLVVGLLCVHFVGHGITLCYHRQLTHKSFRTPKWLERFFVVVALCNFEDTPAKWVAWHRIHHLHSDEDQDPHSPLVHFLWSHFGWLLLHNVGTHDVAAYHKYARDILDDPFYLALERRRWISLAIYVGHAALFFAAAFGVALALGSTTAAATRLAASVVVWGVIVRTVAVWHITWSVNSLTHVFGYRNYETTDNSRNNWFVALLTVGEGWHNNHHEDQASASNQHKWWEFDVVYYEIKLLEALGLATHVIPPRHVREAGRKTG